jgi:predicted metalloprotease with PDZ domain
MKKETITIEVNADTAKAYRETPPETQRKINLLLSLELDDAIREDDISLKKIMQEMRQEAKERGLTPEILQSILDEKE